MSTHLRDSRQPFRQQNFVLFGGGYRCNLSAPFLCCILFCWNRPFSLRTDSWKCDMHFFWRLSLSSSSLLSPFTTTLRSKSSRNLCDWKLCASNVTFIWTWRHCSISFAFQILDNLLFRWIYPTFFTVWRSFVPSSERFCWNIFKIQATKKEVQLIAHQVAQQKNES